MVNLAKYISNNLPYEIPDLGFAIFNNEHAAGAASNQDGTLYNRNRALIVTGTQSGDAVQNIGRHQAADHLAGK